MGDGWGVEKEFKQKYSVSQQTGSTQVRTLGIRHTPGVFRSHRIHVNPHSVWIHSGYTVRYTASGFEDEHVFFAVSERGIIRLRSPSPMPFNPNPDRARRGAGATALVPAPAPAPAPAATALAAAAPAAIVMA